MKYTKFDFKKINPYKNTIVYTWDDNFIRHFSHIAPLFNRYNIKCTFYVNPGEKNFCELMQNYKILGQNGFEIGSHGYIHCHFSQLPYEDYISSLKISKAALKQMINIDAITFAFPHHDFTEEMLNDAKKIFFETRNTLDNSIRFGFKSYTKLSEIIDAINNALEEKYILVFSGHSIRTVNDQKYCDGYEPVSIDILNETIKKTISSNSVAEILTFSQAALKRYIQVYCDYDKNSVIFSEDQLYYLDTYGLNYIRIGELV